MELIKSSSSIIYYNPNPLKQIELVARNCYKSEDKITDESCIKFVHNLKARKHMVMLEFYPFYFHVSQEVATEILYINNFETINGDLMCSDINLNYVDISCNLRTVIMISKYSGRLASAVLSVHPNLIFLFDKTYNDPANVTIVTSGEVPTFLRYLTARFICDRGVSHELVRHRKCSFAQESTRYCNYGKEKHIRFIIPSWLNLKKGIYTNIAEFLMKNNLPDNDETSIGRWVFNTFQCEKTYQKLIKDEWIAQQARSVLPNDLKTEIIVQARLSEWKHIFEQRCAKTAHPDMQALMTPFREKVCKISNEYNNYFNN